MTAKGVLAAIPGVGVSLLPKLTCPLCWPAYASLLTTLGLGFLISARYLLAITVLFLLVSLSALALRARKRRGYGPAIVGLFASVIVLVAKFSFEYRLAVYGGMFLLMAASLWNSWPKRANQCPRCAPRGHELIQPSAKEGSL
jgi:hypothetical protein